MTHREILIREIEAFCRSKGLSEREFAMLATNNPKFLVRLRRNAVTSRFMETAELFIQKHHETHPILLKAALLARRSGVDMSTLPNMEMVAA